MYQEILQGIRDDSVFLQIKRALDYSNILESPMDKDLFEQGVEIYKQAGKKGITIRSSIDCLIAAIAIKNDSTLIHLDRDYIEIAKYTTLKEKNIKGLL